MTPRCRHAAACGGCPWQHIAYPVQLRLKRQRVQRALSRLSRAVDVDPTVAARGGGASPGDEGPFGFRHKVHFAFDQRRGDAAPAMGHYRAGSKDVLPVDECPVHAARANELAFSIRDILERLRVPAGIGGVARHLVIRASHARAEMLATLVVWQNDPQRLKRVMRDVLASANAPTGWFLNVHDRPGAMLFGPETRRLAGQARLRDEIEGTAHLVSPDAFFQTNVAAACELASRVAEAVPGGAASVLDLYAGGGLFALPLALRGLRVVAVESNATAVADGEASRSLNRIPVGRCRFVTGEVDNVLARPSIARGRFDVVILDPPRIGAGAGVMRALAGLAPSRLIYVSCEPEALADDLAHLFAAQPSWRIRSVTPVDMFPHTDHVETVVIIDRA